MNKGLIIGVVEDLDSRQPVPGALLTMSNLWGGARNASGGRAMGGRSIPLFDESESSRPFLQSRTDDQGRFAIMFHWDPRRGLGAAIHNANCLLAVQRSFTAADTPHGITRENIPLGAVVDLSSIASGVLPNPRDGGGWIGMAIELWSVLREVTLPSAFLTVHNPSPEFYALFSIQRIAAQ